tara:strand:+ start:944 stop:1180 length:237 start_codon:yes stop_codon:yes gene_type:complete
MKITKRQLKKVINEIISDEDPGELPYIEVDMAIEQLVEKLASKYFDGQLGDGAYNAKINNDPIAYEILSRAAKLARRK